MKVDGNFHFYKRYEGKNGVYMTGVDTDFETDVKFGGDFPDDFPVRKTVHMTADVRPAMFGKELVLYVQKCSFKLLDVD